MAQRSPNDENDPQGNSWTQTLGLRRVVGIEGAVNKSIGELTSFTDKDVPHFMSTVVNAGTATACTYYFAKTREDVPERFIAIAAGLLMALATWECEELNLAYFGGLLIAASRVLRIIYMSSDYDQIVWTLAKTWLVTGNVLFLFLIFVVSSSYRQKLKRHRAPQQPKEDKKLE